MKRNFLQKAFSFFMALLILLLALPLNVFAEARANYSLYWGMYLKDVKLTEGLPRDEAKRALESAGYTFLDRNLNEGTGEGEVYLGYTMTNNLREAIYDIKLMNMKGGFTLTSIEKAVEAQTLAMQDVANDLATLAEAFADAYERGTVPAEKAFKALNFFRMVRESGESTEGNGLGDRIINGGLGVSDYLEMLLFCDTLLVDSIVQILTMGILGNGESWLDKLSELGPYYMYKTYGEDEMETEKRASALLPVLQLYAETYNALDKTGALSGTFDEAFEIQGASPVVGAELTPEERDLLSLDISRYKLYKLAFEELANYTYGDENLASFFAELSTTSDTRELYPLVLALSDGEYAAMSFGCVFDLILGADTTEDDFEDYDEVYNNLTSETSSVYLYEGVSSILLESDTVVAFTEEANRHIADTGEMEFFENESWGEKVRATGTNAAKAIACIASGLFAVSKVTVLGAMAIGTSN